VHRQEALDVRGLDAHLLAGLVDAALDAAEQALGRELAEAVRDAARDDALAGVVHRPEGAPHKCADELRRHASALVTAVSMRRPAFTGVGPDPSGRAGVRARTAITCSPLAPWCRRFRDANQLTVVRL